MKRFVFIILFTSMLCQVWGQEFFLKQISEHPVDSLLAANNYFDLNGNKASIVILSFSDPVRDLSFRGNVLAEKSTHDNSTYIVYLATKSKRLTLQHEDFFPFIIDFQKYGKNIEGGHSYMISIDVKKPVNSPIQETKGSQYIIFKSEESISKIMVNGEVWPVVDNRVSKLVPLGLYQYIAESVDGKIARGEVNLKSKITSKVVNIVFD